MIIKVNCSSVGVDHRVGGRRFGSGPDSLGPSFDGHVWGGEGGGREVLALGRSVVDKFSELSRITQATPLYPWLTGHFVCFHGVNSTVSCSLGSYAS